LERPHHDSSDRGDRARFPEREVGQVLVNRPNAAETVEHSMRDEHGEKRFGRGGGGLGHNSLMFWSNSGARDKPARVIALYLPHGYAHPAHFGKMPPVSGTI
jgi:hypothetical protein